MISSGHINEKMSIGTVRRNENIEKDRSIIVAIREQYYSKQQQAGAPSESTPLQTALLAGLKSKLRANESELTELRKLVDSGKAGVPVSQLLSSLGCQTGKISCLGGTDNDVLQKLEAAILKKEDECHKARELVAEANSYQQGSAPRNPVIVSSVLPSQSSRSSSSSRTKKKSLTAAPEKRSDGSEESRRVPRVSKTNDGSLLDESSHSSKSKSSHSSSSSKTKKKSVTRASEMRSGESEGRRLVPKSSKSGEVRLTQI
jgi:hypothetical protein